MKIENRSIVKEILLSIITCGIYGIIWLYKMMKEAVSVKDANDSGMVEFLVSWFIPCVGFYLAEKKFAEGCAAKGIAHEDKTILYVILGIVFPIANYCIMQSELNKLAD